MPVSAQAFKSTANRTSLRLAREVENIGASVHASASREQMAYSIDAFRAQVYTLNYLWYWPIHDMAISPNSWVMNQNEAWNESFRKYLNMRTGIYILIYVQ